MKHASSTRRRLRILSLAVAFALSTGSAMAAETTNPDADNILRAMSKFLTSTKAFSVSADISNEIITVEGQKLQMNSSATAVLERPSHVYVARQGKFADTEIFFDGKSLTLYGKTNNTYVQKDVSGTTDDALSALEKGVGINLPGGDLLIANPYATLISGVTSSGYYGTETVAGVECHHLAFRTAKVDWQIWVKTGDEPLPMKYVITTKWTTGAPQYSVQFANWNTKPTIAASRFTFVIPKGAQKLAGFTVDETGEIIVPQEKK